MYYSVFYRVIIALLCVGPLLGGCTVYNSIFHPHRLGTPRMTANARAKAKATEKARHKGLTLASPDTEEGKSSDADGASAAANAGPANDARSQADKNKAIEDMLGNTYNTKTGLLKRNKLQRMRDSKRQLHHYDLSTPPHTQATRDARHMRKHSKGGSGKEAPEPKVPKEAVGPVPAADPTQPASEPRPTKAPAKPAVKAPAAKPAPVKAVVPAKAPKSAKAAKQKPDKKAPKAPKPDPTQPLNGNQ